MPDVQREIEMVSTDSLTPYEGNPRKHPEKHVDALVESIKEFGWTTPLFVADDTVLAGHGRLLAAKKMGATEVPVVRLDDLTPEQRRAYIVADNRLAEMSSWDKELLAVELGELEAFEFDLQKIGFEPLEIEALKQEFNVTPLGDDDVPVLPSEHNIVTMTFVLSQAQKDSVEKALAVAIDSGKAEPDEVNQNKNGAALAVVAEAYTNG